MQAVQPRESAWAQLFQANMAPSEQAWKAVRENFPDADSYVHDLANAGLVRYHLLLSQDRDYEKALRPLIELTQSSDAASPDSPLRAFAFAGLCIANQRLGRVEEAQQARGQLTSEMQDTLRRTDSRMYELLQSSLDALGE